MAKVETVIFSIKTSDNSFETSVSIPMAATPEARDKAIGNWLKLARLGLETRVTDMAVAFDGGFDDRT